MSVGSRVKELRFQLRLNQTDFGRNIGKGQTAIGLYENGQREVSESIIILICEIYGVSETWLRAGEGEMFLPASRQSQGDRPAYESSPLFDVNMRILELRTKLGLSQESFAHRLSLVRSSVSNYESKMRAVPERTIAQVVKEFNVNEEWLRTGEGEMFIRPDEELTTLFENLVADPDQFKRDLIVSLLKLTPEKWELLKEIVQDIKITE